MLSVWYSLVPVPKIALITDIHPTLNEQQAGHTLTCYKFSSVKKIYFSYMV